MEIKWPGEFCILCLKRAPLTLEHVIPDSLGGILTARFICKSCNDRMGHRLEAHARTDPAIRIAVNHLQAEIPGIYTRIEEGQRYTVRSGPAQIAVRYRRGEFEGNTKLSDGSLMLSNQDASGAIETVLSKSGHDTEYIKQALERFDNAPEGQMVQISPRLRIVNWPTETPKYDFSEGIQLDPLVSVKIAYEFLALLTGRGIYTDVSQLNEIRQVLTDHCRASSTVSVDPLSADRYAPFHGLFFEGNDPHAKVQIRLFGKLAYRVQFRRLAIDAPKMSYTHDLVTGDEYRQEVGSTTN